MIPFVPFDEPSEPNLDRGFRLEAEIAPRRLYIGEALRHIAGL